MSLLDLIRRKIKENDAKKWRRINKDIFDWEMEKLDPEGSSEARGGQKRRADYEWDKYNNPREHAVTPEKEGVSIIGNLGSISHGNHYEVEVDGVMKLFNWNEGPLAGKLDSDPNNIPADDMYTPEKGAWKTENYDPNIIGTSANAKRQYVRGGERLKEMYVDQIMKLLKQAEPLQGISLFDEKVKDWEEHMNTRKWYRPETSRRYGNKGKKGEAALDTLPHKK